MNNTNNQVQITQMLIELLLNGAQHVQQRAVTALRRLVEENPAAHEAIAKAGEPSAVVELLKNGISESKQYALWSLSLSITHESQGTVLESGGVQPLISQLADERIFIREQAASALAKLALDNAETRAAITQVGGVKPLVALLSADGPQHADVRRNGANALANLASDNAARAESTRVHRLSPPSLSLCASLSSAGPAAFALSLSPYPSCDLTPILPRCCLALPPPLPLL